MGNSAGGVSTKGGEGVGSNTTYVLMRQHNETHQPLLKRGVRRRKMVI
jgi:hypothetical protein